ncbi:MAG TPA: ATP-binding protein [Oceanobacillus sp.]|nr:ATP-binding protein [Oceanobacillus sp.]
MTVDDLWQAVKNGRNARLDWLAESAPIDAIAANLTAMANTQGGTLVIGIVGPTATLIGVRDVENVLDRLIQASLSIDPPLIIPMPRALRLNDRPVVVAQIPPGMPHVYSLDGRYLIRSGTDNSPLKPRELRRLMIERGEVSFETDIARGASLDDLDWERVRAYVAGLGGIPDSGAETLLLRRGCLTEQDGRLRPTNAGILLFGKDPQSFLRGAEITAARFAGETMGDTFTKQDITGNLPEQLRRAETFLIDNLRRGVHIGKSMARAESLEYPLEAARELVVNAVAHRDYSITGDGIRLFIFRDRMEVISPGGLPGPVTIDNIKEERFSRNPIIVQILSDLGYIERLGYGVDRVYDLMRERQLRAPQFEETSGGFRAVLFNQTEPQAAGKPGSETATPYFGEYRGIPVNPRQEAAIAFLNSGNSRITNSDLQSLCPDVHPETIRRDLADLVTKNILKKLGEKRGSYYVFKTD